VGVHGVDDVAGADLVDLVKALDGARFRGSGAVDYVGRVCHGCRQARRVRNRAKADLDLWR